MESVKYIGLDVHQSTISVALEKPCKKRKRDRYWTAKRTEPTQNENSAISKTLAAHKLIRMGENELS